MQANNPIITKIVVPSNAGPGDARIEITGNGIISYYADGNIAWEGTIDNGPAGALLVTMSDSFSNPFQSSLANGQLQMGNPIQYPPASPVSMMNFTQSDGTFSVEGWDELGNLFTCLLTSSGFGEGSISTIQSGQWQSGDTIIHPSAGTGWTVSPGTLRSAPPVFYYLDITGHLHIRGAMATTSATPSSTPFVLDGLHTPAASANLQQDYIYQQSSAGVQKGPAHVFLSGSSVSINNLTATAIGDIVNFNHTFSMGLPA